jgi:hypothetical protein
MSNDYEIAGEPEGHEHEADTLEAKDFVSEAEVTEVQDLEAKELLAAFIDYLRGQKLVLCTARQNRHHQGEYIQFAGDLRAIITAFLAGR